MSDDKQSKGRCAWIECGNSADLLLREAEDGPPEERTGWLYIGRVASAVQVLPEDSAFQEVCEGDIWFSDGYEEGYRPFADMLCLNPQIFSVCYSGLFGERLLTLFRSLARTRYCHPAGMEEHGELEAALQSLWRALDASDAATETILSALWNMAAILRRYLGSEAGELASGTLRGRRRLMPVLQYIQKNYAAKITLSDMAGLVNMSVPNFSAVFRKTMGMPPVEFVIRLRVHAASAQLKNTDKKIIDIAEDCGFSSISNFIKAFRRYYGISPLQYRTDRTSKD